ncbi:hypothetical protein BDA99DRAFT_537740 [Phascolomyces articulosus]|uniref:Uncharacterized protein n=1 Tax=Phascolomyces articulosus TaxID=60185 RepID=A0AAD5K9I3_9FUNG|nr:hypothetical protein BDA99DRAFT_537740 [Phascolomyces articulosus]
MLCPFMTKTVEAVLPFYMVAFHHTSKKKVLGRKSYVKRGPSAPVLSVMPFLKLRILNHGMVSKVNDFLYVSSWSLCVGFPLSMNREQRLMDGPIYNKDLGHCFFVFSGSSQTGFLVVKEIGNRSVAI